MGSLVVTNKMLDKYFRFLKDLDDKTKKMLINKLTGSMKEKPEEDFELKSLFGAWEDSSN